jgi:hypothetical protein
MSTFYALLPLISLRSLRFLTLVRKDRPKGVTLVSLVVLKGLSKNKLFMLEKKKDNLYLLVFLKK